MLPFVFVQILVQKGWYTLRQFLYFGVGYNSLICNFMLLLWTCSWNSQDALESGRSEGRYIACIFFFYLLLQFSLLPTAEYFCSSFCFLSTRTGWHTKEKKTNTYSAPCLWSRALYWVVLSVNSKKKPNCSFQFSCHLWKSFTLFALLGFTSFCIWEISLWPVNMARQSKIAWLKEPTCAYATSCPFVRCCNSWLWASAQIPTPAACTKN